ncbi:sulfurtransferase [Limibaculum sp. M0105]|uniref:Sulfurtransferase n=1 Tax=Thermohalobaculum xanthum TaxID=2753746 RepID=A0A8J7SDI8_9RHOB|nr:rhodanese-like domain-containing protein [Thermohalobaculum xanthum]MBK0398457.1 sulfurtransferase [Thermohalobaculum xanthum]
MWKHVIAAGACVIALASPAGAADIRSSVDAATLDKKKSTPLGLYLTPQDAHAALQADPAIVFVDVRDPIEVAFVGHPEGIDANVPVKIATHRFDGKKGDYVMEPNAGFVAQVEAVLAREGRGKTDPVFVMCRSGGRSAAAARQLIEAGFTNVWNLVEGFEGDSDKASGQRTLNGWRNAGLPWSYKLDERLAWQPTAN